MSVYFQTLHKKGSLANVLNALSARDVNLSKLQSHPVPSRNQLYGFYADLEIPNGDSSDSIVEELSTLTSYFDLLGVYQKDRWSDE